MLFCLTGECHSQGNATKSINEGNGIKHHDTSGGGTIRISWMHLVDITRQKERI